MTDLVFTDSAFFCRLSHEGLLAVRGPDASKFLQGQLTCNINYLNEHTSSLGARCTPKGRMISSFRIVQDGDGYLLALAIAGVPLCGVRIRQRGAQPFQPRFGLGARTTESDSHGAGA